MTILLALAEAQLADRPGGVDAAHAHLLDVRDAVHVVTGRGRDRLSRGGAAPSPPSSGTRTPTTS